MKLLVSSAKTPAQCLAAVVYGTAVIMLFTVSTIFHVTCVCSKKKYVSFHIANMFQSSETNSLCMSQAKKRAA